MGHTHLIGRKSTSFIGADDISTAKSFNTRQIPNDCILLGHFLCAQRQTRRNNSGQTLRDSSDGEGNCNLEIVDCTLQNSMMRRIRKMAYVDDPDENADDGDNLGEQVSEIVQFSFKRCLFGYLCRNRFMYVTNGRFLTGVNDDSFGITIDNGGTLREQT